MEVTFNALIHEVNAVEESKAGSKFQRIILKVPARINQFGEVVGSDEFFEVIIFKPEKITEFWEGNPTSDTNKIKITCFVNSTVREYNGKTFYNTQLAYKSRLWIK